MKRQIPFTYTSASSERRAIRNRERDPSWVPRPANAFIIFRSEYSREHAQSHKTDGTPPPPEKTLSKRAAEAWSKLTEDEKAPYKVRADEERIEHAKRFPDYRYRPRRRNSGANRSSAAPSRREQVESFMRRAAASHNHGADSESDYSAECSSPATSITGSSSPEPPDIAISSSVDSRDPRSQSFPRGNMSLRTRSGLPFFNGSTPSLTSSGDTVLFKPRSLPDDFDLPYPTPPGSQYTSSESDDGHSVHSLMDSPMSGPDGDSTHGMMFNVLSPLPVRIALIAYNFAR